MFSCLTRRYMLHITTMTERTQFRARHRSRFGTRAADALLSTLQMIIADSTYTNRLFSEGDLIS